MRAEVLRVEHLTIRENGSVLIDDVNFLAYSGEILSICGYHYAGKSLLVQALIGQIESDSGSISMPNGMNIRTNIQRIHQSASALQDYSIAENLFVFCHKRRHLILNRREIENRTDDILGKLGLRISPNTEMSMLTTAQQHLLLIMKAAYNGASIVILDNTCINYNDEEYRKLLQIMGACLI